MTFVVAAGLFGTLALSLAAVTPLLPSPETRNIDVASASESSLGVLLGSGGSPSAWGTSDAAADSVQRLGLLENPNSIRIGEDKLRRLQGAMIAGSTNGKVDYDEAVAALGLSGYDFHLRTMPVFDPFNSGYFGVEGLETTRIAYIGDYSNDGVTESAHSQTEGQELDAFPVAYTNLKFAPSQAAPGGDKFPDEKETLKLHLLLRFGGWMRTEGGVLPDTLGTHTWRLFEAGGLGGIPTGVTGTHAVAMGKESDPGYTGLENDRLVSPIVDVRTLASPRITFREYIDGRCTLVAGSCLAASDYGLVQVSSTSGLASWTTLTTSVDGWSSGGAWRTRTVDLSACGPCAAGPVYFGFHWTSDASSHGKGWVIDDVRVESATTGATAWTTGSDFASSYYDIVIVGSNVDQNGLNEAAIKFSIRDWVLAGGTLIVVGSTANSDNWMQPIFGAGLSSGAGGAPFTPDPTHPILSTPNKLAYATYPTDGNTWKIVNAYQSKFTQVIGDPPSQGQDRNDILSLSVPGAYGTGTVILTTYLPYLMTGDEDAKLLANFFMYGRYSVLYLDYGKQIPKGVPVGETTRLVLAPKTIDPIGPRVEMLVTMQVWR